MRERKKPEAISKYMKILVMRPAWSSEQDPGQSRLLHRETLSRITKQTNKKQKIKTKKQQKKWSDASSGVLKTDTNRYQREDKGNGC